LSKSDKTCALSTDCLDKYVYSDDFERPSHEDMFSKVLQLRRKYSPTKIYLDGANPAFIRSLKLNIGESADYDKVIEQSNLSEYKHKIMS
jgi:hypothetical protein